MLPKYNDYWSKNAFFAFYPSNRVWTLARGFLSGPRVWQLVSKIRHSCWWVRHEQKAIQRSNYTGEVTDVKSNWQSKFDGYPQSRTSCRHRPHFLLIDSSAFNVHLLTKLLTSGLFWCMYTAIRWHWPLMGGLLHLVQRGGAWTGCGPAQSPSRCTRCNSPPINGQCTNFILFDAAQ